MKCENLESCPFYNGRMSMDHGIGALFQKKYCQGNQQRCARYQVYCKLGAEYVPDNLYPNMEDVARKIVEEGMK